MTCIKNRAGLEQPHGAETLGSSFHTKTDSILSGVHEPSSPNCPDGGALAQGHQQTEGPGRSPALACFGSANTRALASPWREQLLPTFQPSCTIQVQSLLRGPSYKQRGFRDHRCFRDQIPVPAGLGWKTIHRYFPDRSCLNVASRRLR